MFADIDAEAGAASIDADRASGANRKNVRDLWGVGGLESTHPTLSLVLDPSIDCSGPLTWCS
jgi:hypothetical protein